MRNKMAILENFQAQLIQLGFVEKTNNFFIFENNKLNQITVDLNNESSGIEYSSEIQIDHNGLAGLDTEENLVTVICVAQLLKRGYSARNLHLEKTWKLGHQSKGRLDVLIYKEVGKTRKPWAMIECKVSAEHDTFADKMRSDGGQLFSYWFQDRDAEALYLYSADFSNKILKFRADFLEVSSLDTKATSVEALHASWDGTFSTLGIFHPLATAYDSEKRLLRLEDLQTLEAESGKGIFNQFTELLRQYSVSDKSNAFNKIFNLFLCKIIDEDTTPPNTPLKFQDNFGSDTERLIQDLDELYRVGLEKYLGIQVDQTLVSGAQNFGFIEVFDKSSFERNLRILRGVVRILQPFKIKYSSKQQHLGDFFELLLNEGVKQESGQFFTPVPLTHFAVLALPTEKILNDSIARGGDAIFPRIIDFACGSGHFLTEAIDVFQHIIDKVDDSRIASARDKTQWRALRNSYFWTKDSVFGIEKDYRLAKVTKIATFLNGDGDATILHGDGLDSFSSDNYSGILRSKFSENGNFDVVVANPPYSVSNFLEGSRAKNADFNLKSFIKPKSSEIEVLFIERTSQLLRPGGVAALVLPAGIFSNENSGSYNAARKLVASNFKIRAILNLGKDAFMATGIKTVMVFLEKREVLLDDQIDGADGTTWFSRLKASIQREQTLVAWMPSGQEEKNYLGYGFTSRRGSEGIIVYERSSLYPTSLVENELVSGSAPNYLDGLVRKSFLANDSLSEFIDQEKGKLSSLDEALQLDLNVVYENLNVAYTKDLFELNEGVFKINIRASELDSRGRFDFAAAGMKSQSLGDLMHSGDLQVFSGKRPKGGVARNRSGILSLGGEHVHERLGKLDISSPKYVQRDFLTQRNVSDMTLHANDILLCKDGARSGKVAWISQDDVSGNDPVLINEHLFRLVLGNNLNTEQAKSIFLFFMSAEGRAEMDTATAGTGQGGISISRLQRVKVPVIESELAKEIVQIFDSQPLEAGFSFSQLLSKLQMAAS